MDKNALKSGCDWLESMSMLVEQVLRADKAGKKLPPAIVKTALECERLAKQMGKTVKAKNAEFQG